MNRLLEIGFQPAGHWFLAEGKLKFDLTRNATQTNILYAFVCDAEVMYVGKTIRTLAARMAGYKTPGKTQTTNINNNQRILELLEHGAVIEILALPDNGLLHYGKFHINLAAALEDDIIRKLDPLWNGGKPEKITDSETESPHILQELTSTPAETFSFILQPTYYRSGFFNVGVSSQKYIGADGETIEIFLGQAISPILGTINRRANTNGTPRIMGGTAVRNWFQKNAKAMDRIGVQVLSPNSIRLSING
ncbi:GIY-YIG nuclease family protein [Methylobacillus caricis]|uniref:GIY-YIG nuclease family protein n=1 Tax=Methylobacillus caricis TaxID=1971611 RepID=UPI001CFFED88|nr:GIY-YIG nuclease family protein [Methylobacillus caricis]MCB5187204.1 GIY-YIG nuclease family protein [Methylobacillus caricis]